MSAHDIFNPHRGFDAALGFNANWNYGPPRKPGANLQIQKPRLGTWSTREVSNLGYSFDLTFVDRPIEQVHYISRFYHQFKFGFFTLIDHDNGGREHVGRFTSYSDDTQTANLKYTVRTSFEEVPRAMMRRYPDDWPNQSHIQAAVDDWGNHIAAASNAATIAQAVPGVSGPLPHPQELYLAAAQLGDFIQTQYVGWGFRMSLRQSPALGTAKLYVDGQLLLGIDLSVGTLIPTLVPGGITAVTSGGGSGTGIPLSILVEDLPLDAHRVKLAADTPVGSGTDLLFPMVQVMH